MLADLTWVSLVWAAAPEDEDVVAGPIGFIIFIGLCLAVAVLGWSLNKHLRKAHNAAEAGVFGEPEAPAESTADGDGGSSSDGSTSG